MGGLRAVTAASALPAATSVTASSSSARFPVANLLPFPLRLAPAANSYSGASRTPPNAAAFRMDSLVTDRELTFQMRTCRPELLTEFMVDMFHCDGCVKSATNNLLKLEGDTAKEILSHSHEKLPGTSLGALTSQRTLCILAQKNNSVHTTFKSHEINHMRGPIKG